MSTVAKPAEFDAAASAFDQHLSSLSDADLLDAWVNDRHRDSLAALIDRYRVMVMSVCRRRCRSESDADDAFQAAFLYLARNAKSIRDPRRLPGWLHRVAQRAATATLKHTTRETIAMVDTPAQPDDPLDRLTQRHEAIVLDEELADLPEHYRAALVMHILHGQSLGQLADQFGVTVGSIRGRLQRGKQLLANRLRRRGIVPILAYAAAQACTASSVIAASASETLIASIKDLPDPNQLPRPPIEPSLLNSLLREGTRLMPSLYTAGGLVVGTGLLSLMMLFGDGTAQTNNAQPNVQIPAAISTSMVEHQAQISLGESRPSDEEKRQQTNKQSSEPSPLVSREPITKIAKQAEDALDQAISLPEAFSLIELPGLIEEATKVPVILDQRGIDFAEVEMANQLVEVKTPDAPMRSVLRTILEPSGLKVIVESEGLTITADSAVLVHRDIGATRWINIDEEAERRIALELDTKISIQFIDTALDDAMRWIADETLLPIYIDRRSLEDHGLTPDVPVTMELDDVGLANALDLLLGELQLAYTIRGETFVIATTDSAAQNLLTRIYWLEGTGFASGDFDSLIESIQSSIDPNGWDALGGPATISLLDTGSSNGRPAIVVSNHYVNHRRIERFIAALRETHFGAEPSPATGTATTSTSVRNQRSSNKGGRMMGGGDGFGGGMGGGGAF